MEIKKDIIESRIVLRNLHVKYFEELNSIFLKIDKMLETIQDEKEVSEDEE